MDRKEIVMDLIKTKKSRYEVYIGCEEWQDSGFFNSMVEVQRHIRSWELEDFTMGSHSATEGWIENIKTGDIVNIDITVRKGK